MEITFDRKNVSVCLQQQFELPTYQRDYKWELKHLQELLNDIQESFLSNYQDDDGRSAVGGYTPYFLGTIITTDAGEGRKAVIDGQQRLTTLSVILAYFFRMRKKYPEKNISNIEPLLRQEVFGSHSLNITFDEDRSILIDILLSSDHDDDKLKIDEKVDSISNITSGTRQLYNVFSSIENYLSEDISENLLPWFIDYLIQKVYLFEIGVPSEQNGHTVFVTMNDRGLKLSPIDLLKGYLLSKIQDDGANQAAHAKWVECVRMLGQIGSDEDSTFFKTWLRARYANSMRGKSKGDSAGDFDLIGEAYHRWIITNSSNIGLNNSDDYYDFVRNEISVYASHYEKIKKAESKFDPEFPHVFYNGAKDITLQSMVILAALEKADTAATVDKKVKIVSCHLDHVLSARVINSKDNTYDNIKHYMFSLCQKIRGRTVTELSDILYNDLDAQEHSISKLESASYTSIKRQDLLHILGRIAEYLENGSQQMNSVGFPGYSDRSRGARTFDVEHIFPENPTITRSDLGAEFDFSNDDDYAKVRDNIGSLILLPRGKNRSLKAAPYSEKLPKYATDNILAQTLHPEMYNNNPQLNAFISSQSISAEPFTIFNSSSVEKRRNMYLEISRKIWNRGNIIELSRM